MKKLFLFLFIIPFSLCAQTELAPIEVSVANYDHHPMINDKVMFVGQKSKKSYFVITGANGKAKLNLPSGEIYDIKIDAIGEAMEYNTMEIPSIPKGYGFETMQLIIEYRLPEVVTLSNLQFETGKSIIQTASIPQLDQLVDYLKRKPLLKIKVVGHTDNVGNEASNLQLSKDRAEVVKKYLIDKGIAANRLQSEGLGASVPVADNTTVAGKAKNRRTEIHVITK